MTVKYAGGKWGGRVAGSGLDDDVRFPSSVLPQLQL
jgi:hypothetical protein